MGKAFRHKASRFYQNEALLAQVKLGLAYWVEHDFVEDNWHNNQITTPTNLGNLMLLLGNELPEDLIRQAQPMIARAHMNASGASPSGDRIVIAGILARNLLFTSQSKAFEGIVEHINGELKFRTGKRGMQHDFSYLKKVKVGTILSGNSKYNLQWASCSHYGKLQRYIIFKTYT